MKLTVDASVVVKWFLTEPQSDEARRLLTPRFHLHAPDILLAEYANTIWKKVHRNEISSPQPYVDEIASLSEVVVLERGSDIFERAARIAVEMDHPVYDCLYLACAEATGSVPITADRQFAKKTAGRGVEVWRLGAPGVADRIDAAATAPIISEDKVAELIDAYEVFAATERHVVEALRSRRRSGAQGLTALTMADMDLYLDSPAYKRLVGLVSDLGVEERADLLALGWLGAGLLDANWQRNLEHASEMAGMDDKHYVAGYGQHWRAGYTRLQNLMQARRRSRCPRGRASTRCIRRRVGSAGLLRERHELDAALERERRGLARCGVWASGVLAGDAGDDGANARRPRRVVGAPGAVRRVDGGRGHADGRDPRRLGALGQVGHDECRVKPVDRRHREFTPSPGSRLSAPPRAPP